MSRFTMIILWLALAAATVFGQGPTSPQPAPQPTTFPVTNSTARACEGQADLVVTGEQTFIARTCESAGKVSFNIIGGGFQNGFVNAVSRTSDGGVMILMDNGNVVRNRNGVTQWFPISRATAFLSVSYDRVITLREQGEPWSYALNWDGSFYAKPAWDQRVFPSTCNQIIQSQAVGDLYCFDKSNGSISQATASLMRPARPDEAKPYFQMQGLVYVREYKGGLLGLVTAQYDCGDAQPLPGGATFCYFAGACRIKSPSRLIYITGREQASAIVVAQDLNIVYSSTFAVDGDAVLLVESQFDNEQNWHGDYVTKLNLVTGKKTVYVSLTDVATMFGPGLYGLWIN